MQTFTAPLNTTYKIQCWGAQGGNSYEEWDNSGPTGHTSIVYGGKGSYCSGDVNFPKNLNVYIYVGQTGVGTTLTTLNGGGSGGSQCNGLSGGGATDIRLINGDWNNFESLKSRIIVAAGGGGAQHYFEGCIGGYAGGLLGQDGFYSVDPSVEHGTYTIATGATQNSGGVGWKSNLGNGYNGDWGVGGNHGNSHNHGGGGGGGYYGGGGGGNAYRIVGSGAGGSSFISGYSGCDAIAESSTEDNIIHTGQPNHYSSYVFTNPVMIDGGSTMPSPSGGTETGHSGNGYCIITWRQLPQ